MVGGLDKNFSYLIHDTNTNNAVIVDPSGDMSEVYATISEKGLGIIGIYLTHTHHDHLDALEKTLEKYGGVTYIGAQFWCLCSKKIWASYTFRK